MLQTVDIGPRALHDYVPAVGEAIIEEIRALAATMRGVRVLQINATPYGGGVSELLRSIIPLQRNLGLVADWKIIQGDEPFFGVTKALHNGLQGARTPITAEQRERFLETSRRNAAQLEEAYDIIVVHDPQPAALLSLHGKGDARWIWRCHIDTGAPSPDTWGFLRPFLEGYDAAIFTMQEFVPPDLPIARRAIIPPAIDPLSPKNLEIDEELIDRVLGWIGIDASSPLVTQVSRFDPWKDPLGVIEAYRIARRAAPDLQLALVGSMALDDPEGWEVYRRIAEASSEDPRIQTFTNLTGVGNLEVNAFQRRSRVVIQKSLREGFGLVVSEALWKGTPVIAGLAGGIPMQMPEGTGGYLVKSPQECGERLIELLRNRPQADALAASGREHVREHFLLPRLLRDELQLFRALLDEAPLPEREWETEAAHGARDIVCGLPLPGDANRLLAEHDGEWFAFCSEACRRRFRQEPGLYVAAPVRR